MVNSPWHVFQFIGSEWTDRLAPCFACPFSPFSHSPSPSRPSICLDQSVDFANTFPSPLKIWWIILDSLVWSAIRDIIDYTFSFYMTIYLIDFLFLLWLLKVDYFQEQMTRNNWFYVSIKESAEKCCKIDSWGNYTKMKYPEIRT